MYILSNSNKQLITAAPNLKNNLVNPKVLMEQNNNGETVLHHLIKSNDNTCTLRKDIKETKGSLKEEHILKTLSKILSN